MKEFLQTGRNPEKKQIKWKRKRMNKPKLKNKMLSKRRMMLPPAAGHWSACQDLSVSKATFPGKCDRLKPGKANCLLLKNLQ